MKRAMFNKLKKSAIVALSCGLVLSSNLRSGGSTPAMWPDAGRQGRPTLPLQWPSPQDFPEAVINDGEFGLCLAASTGCLTIVTFFLETEIITQYDKNLALHYAAAYGQVEIIKYLLKKGAEVKFQDYCGFTPLHLAVFHNRLEAVAVLLKNGADPNVTNADGKKPSQGAFPGIDDFLFLAENHTAAVKKHADTLMIMMRDGCSDALILMFINDPNGYRKLLKETMKKWPELLESIWQQYTTLAAELDNS